jgi:adenylyl-sulfate kinase
MFTGASTAHVAILLVDATAGVQRQTRRHARIAALLGVRHLVAAVNKIDLTGYDHDRYTEVESLIHRVTDRPVASQVRVIPIAAKHGDNVVRRSANTPWYSGPTLLEHLESIELVAPRPHYRQLRLPVQWVSRPLPGERRRYTGRLSAGTVTVGDTVRVLPAGVTSTVTAVDTLDDSRAVAVAPLSVSVELADNIDVGRGSVLISGDPDAPQPVLARELDATICWFGRTPLRAGDRLSLKHTTATVRATVGALHRRLDPETLDEHDGPTELALNDIGSITLRTSSILIADRYADNRDAGAFILIVLVESGRTAYLLDGDNVRHGLSDDLGFSPGDRAENIRRVGHLTRLFADAGVVAIASLVSPLASDRAIARELNAAAKLPFLEIYVATPLTECERRDPKGLYAKARAGQLTGLTGVDAPYEPPTAPDLILDTTGADIDDMVKQVLKLLAAGEESVG